MAEDSKKLVNPLVVNRAQRRWFKKKYKVDPLTLGARKAGDVKK
jgi:hypothetical protein